MGIGRTLATFLVLALLPGCGGGPGDDPGAADAPRGAANGDSGALPPLLQEAEVQPATGPVERPSFAEAQAAGRARVAFFHVPSSGFAYRGADGRLTGVTVELLRDFARWVHRHRGVEVEVEWLEEERWADFYAHVRDSRGGVFGIGNVTITEARREEMGFSPPYLGNVAVLVTHSNIPELGSMEEIPRTFRSLTALPYPGTLHEARLDALGERYLPDLPRRPVASNDELVSLLASGEGYFGYIDVYNYWRAREAGRPLRRHAVGDDVSESFGVIHPRDSDWGPVLEDFFRADGGYVGSPRYRQLLEAHLGAELAGLLSEG